MSQITYPLLEDLVQDFIEEAHLLLDANLKPSEIDNAILCYLDGTWDNGALEKLLSDFGLERTEVRDTVRLYPWMLGY